MLLFNSRQVYDYRGTCYISKNDLTSDGRRLLPVSVVLKAVTVNANTAVKILKETLYLGNPDPYTAQCNFGQADQSSCSSCLQQLGVQLCIN